MCESHGIGWEKWLFGEGPREGSLEFPWDWGMVGIGGPLLIHLIHGGTNGDRVGLDEKVVPNLP